MAILNKTKSLKKILGLISAIGLTIYLILSIDFNFLVGQVKSIKIGYLLIASLFYILGYVFRAIRFKLIFDSMFLFRQLLLVVCLHNFWNRLLPMRLGELSLPIYLNKLNSQSKGMGFYSLIVVRLMDIMVLVFLFLITMNSANVLDKIDLSVNFFWIIAFILLLILLFLKKVMLLGIRILMKIFGKRSILLDLEKELSLGKLNFNKILLLIIATFLLWLSLYIMFFVLIRGLGYDFSFNEVVFAATFANLTNVLPVSGLGSFGTLEIGWAIGFTILGIDYKTALTQGLFVNLTAFIITSALGVISYIIFTRKFFIKIKD